MHGLFSRRHFHFSLHLNLPDVIKQFLLHFFAGLHLQPGFSRELRPFN